MKKIKNLAFFRNALLLLSFLYINPSLVQAQSDKELIVRFENGTPQDTIDAIKTEFNVTELRITPISEVRLWRLDSTINVVGNPHIHFLIGSDTLDIKESRKRLSSKTKVKTAGENFPTRIISSEVMDNLEDNPSGNLTLCVPRQPVTCSSGECEVSVGVMDTGVDDNNSYLQPWLSFSRGYDFVNRTPNASDDNGHGTHTTGTIVQMADMENANNIRVVPLKTQDKEGEGTVYLAIEALDYAISQRLDIVNMSLGYTADRPQPTDKISPLEYVISLAGNMEGIFVVCAAGNESTDIDVSTKGFYPAGFSCPNLISVAASGCDNQLESYSNYGMVSVDVAAPGGVHSPVLDGKWEVKLGTSMAAAVVTGTASLLATHLCDLDNLENTEDNISYNYTALRNAITETVTKVGLPILTEGIINAPHALNNLTQPSFRKLEDKTEGLSNTLTVFPQPFRQVVHLRWESTDEKRVTIRIFDALGKEVYRHQENANVGINEFEWNSQMQPTGTYWLNVQSGKNTITKKMIKLE
ncbi:MAG: S8 family peptidase [Saprospiraceae bacterium]